MRVVSLHDIVGIRGPCFKMQQAHVYNSKYGDLKGDLQCESSLTSLVALLELIYNWGLATGCNASDCEFAAHEVLYVLLESTQLFKADTKNLSFDMR